MLEKVWVLFLINRFLRKKKNNNNNECTHYYKKFRRSSTRLILLCSYISDLQKILTVDTKYNLLLQLEGVFSDCLDHRHHRCLCLDMTKTIRCNLANFILADVNTYTCETIEEICVKPRLSCSTPTDRAKDKYIPLKCCWVLHATKIP